MCTREIGDEIVEFGTTGYTKDHVFVLYDRTTDSIWWPLSSGTFDGVAGEYQGESIPFLDKPAPLPLGEWLGEHPDSTVLLPSEEDVARLAEFSNHPYLGVQPEDRDGVELDFEVTLGER